MTVLCKTTLLLHKTVLYAHTPPRSLRGKRGRRQLRVKIHATVCARVCVRGGGWQVYSEDQQRWIHCDPCENAWDSPLLYSEAPQHQHVSHPHPHPPPLLRGTPAPPRFTPPRVSPPPPPSTPRHPKPPTRFTHTHRPPAFASSAARPAGWPGRPGSRRDLRLLGSHHWHRVAVHCQAELRVRLKS